jgi:cephalosporin hydroxylase
MRRFFEAVVKPLLDMVAPARIVEIGAAEGGNSALVARWCEDRQARLDVIDTAPRFDPMAFEREHHAAKVHVGRSLDILPRIPPPDVALIDGDHNWYTVYHELKTLAGAAAAHGKPFAACVLHDTAWPYGRRDLYYDPSAIPESHRRPWRRGPIVPNQPGIVEYGLNATLCHAEHEGGPHNGVLTAIEDFISEDPGSFHFAHLPVLFGLSVLIPRATVARVPGLKSFMDDLELNRSWRSLLEIAETERCHGMAATHRLMRLSLSPDLPHALPVFGPSFSPSPPAEVLSGVESGMLRYSYRDRALLKSPFDLALYLYLLGKLRPLTIIEVGTLEGGSALWFADMLTVLGIEGRVVTLARRERQTPADPRITVLTADVLDLGSALPEPFLRTLPRPWLVIEDSAHTFDVSLAVLSFFDGKLASGDYLVIEDGSLRGLSGEQVRRNLDGPSRAIEAFLSTRGGDYEMDRELCDLYSFNGTNIPPNGWLRRKADS